MPELRVTGVVVQIYLDTRRTLQLRDGEMAADIKKQVGVFDSRDELVWRLPGQQVAGNAELRTHSMKMRALYRTSVRQLLNVDHVKT